LQYAFVSWKNAAVVCRLTVALRRWDQSAAAVMPALRKPELGSWMTQQLQQPQQSSAPLSQDHLPKHHLQQNEVPHASAIAAAVVASTCASYTKWSQQWRMRWKGSDGAGTSAEGWQVEAPEAHQAATIPSSFTSGSFDPHHLHQPQQQQQQPEDRLGSGNVDISNGANGSNSCLICYSENMGTVGTVGTVGRGQDSAALQQEQQLQQLQQQPILITSSRRPPRLPAFMFATADQQLDHLEREHQEPVPPLQHPLVMQQHDWPPQEGQLLPGRGLQQPGLVRQAPSGSALGLLLPPHATPTACGYSGCHVDVSGAAAAEGGVTVAGVSHISTGLCAPVTAKQRKQPRPLPVMTEASCCCLPADAAHRMGMRESSQQLNEPASDEIWGASWAQQSQQGQRFAQVLVVD
jgi:hypothetical protein